MKRRAFGFDTYLHYEKDIHSHDYSTAYTFLFYNLKRIYKDRSKDVMNDKEGMLRYTSL